MRTAGTYKGAGVAGALAVLALAGCGHSDAKKPAADKRPVPANGGYRPGQVSFGVLAPLTGAEAARGKDLVDGAKMAMADLNVRGGVLGQKVAIVAYDDKCQARDGRTGAEAVKESEAVGAVGGICASAARSAARELGPVKPFLVTSANTPSIVSAKKTKNAYLINGTPYQSALATVHWLAYSRAQKVSVVTADDRASRYLGSQVLGLSSPVPKPVSQQAVKAIDDTVVKSALTGDPDTVYWAGPPADGGKLLAALTDAGFHGTFIASEASESPEFLSAAGAAAEGAFVIAPATPQNLPEAAEWAAQFKQKFGHEPGLDALQAYNGVRALAQAVTQSGKVDNQRNSQEIEVLGEDYKTFLDTGLIVRVRPHDQVRQQHRAQGRRWEVRGREHAAIGRLRCGGSRSSCCWRPWRAAAGPTARRRTPGPTSRRAYYKASDEGAGARAFEDYWVDEDYHSHANYVPRESLETCPLMQRANAPSAAENAITPTAGQPVPQFVVGPASDGDIRTPSITQGALVFGTSAIAREGMDAVGNAMAKCPAQYEVRGGPSTILGTYSVSARPFESGDWKGVVQQIAHTSDFDEVYYEDAAHVVVQRANVILYLDVTHRKVIGERADASAKAESVVRTVVKRLG